MDNKRKTGGKGEDIACVFLTNLGYEIVERNYQFGHGEIDIIARDGQELVFAEVKYRRSLEYGPPDTAITLGKQKQIRKTAEAYLFDKGIKDVSCRIDVIAILHLTKEDPQIEHFINAF